MDQQTIMYKLQEALAKGSGGLDELDALLTRAKADIVTAKREEEERVRLETEERGRRVADVATRMLNYELTSEDVAFILNGFFSSRNLKAVWTAADVDEVLNNCRKDEKAIAKSASSTVDWDKAAEELATGISDIISDLLGGAKKEEQKTVNKTNTNGKADDIINNFLKKFGLD